MAGDWIKFETATSDKPEVWAMAQSLGIDADAVVGKLLRVWAWFDQQTQEGNAVGNGASVTSSVTKALLDRRVGVSGFCDSMILSGWMADDGHSLTLPNFDRHNGKTAKDRALTAKRAANHRSNANSNASTVTSIVTDALPREEKRREEKNIDTLVISQANDKPDCPHQEIISLYHEVLPQCPKVRDWTQARQTQLRTRWNESADRQNLDYWRRLFEYVGECDFLTGRTAKPFFADLEWITKTANFTKIRERKYENRVAA